VSMKDWKVIKVNSLDSTQGVRSENGYILCHYHHKDKENSMAKWPGWWKCYHNINGWRCSICKTFAPEEIGFCADLAGCEEVGVWPVYP